MDANADNYQAALDWYAENDPRAALTLAVDVEAGRVTSARIVDRSWAGAGVAETESCLVRSVRGWRLGSSDARIVLPLSFTSPVRAPR